MAGRGQPLSFLERFEGKKATISKEGLLHLFNNNPPSPRPEPQHKQNLITKQHLQSSARQIIRCESQAPPKEPPSSRLSYRTEAVRKGQESRDFMLPNIRGRFNNSHQSLYNQGRHNQTEKLLKKVQIDRKRPEADRKKKSESEGSKGGYMLNKNMDVNALEHLQFLTRLQEKLVKDRR